MNHFYLGFSPIQYFFWCFLTGLVFLFVLNFDTQHTTAHVRRCTVSPAASPMRGFLVDGSAPTDPTLRSGRSRPRGPIPWAAWTCSTSRASRSPYPSGGGFVVLLVGSPTSMIPNINSSKLQYTTFTPN